MTRVQFEKAFITARREFISREFAHLNDMQQKAAMTTSGPLLLLAGAGSGKTTVLINRVANLLKFGCGSDSDYVPSSYDESDLEFLQAYLKDPKVQNYDRAVSLCAVDPVDPWRIIAITFTNKAADELKIRLENMLGPEALDIWALTFHSACVRILRRDIDKMGFDRSFTIYDTNDSLAAMKRILKDLEMDEKVFPPRTILGYISKAKDSMISPEDYIASASSSYDVRKKLVGEAYAAYTKRLKDANALDFDDLILFTVKLLLEHEDVREYYQNKFKYVLIDEYQDTNNLQYLLASTLAGGRKNICVVGDDDQSIYKFRGATIENILSFEKQYKNAKVIRLEQNYRSTSHILDASNAVIRHNTERKGKELWTKNGDGEKLRLYVSQNENDEAQYVASQILSGFSDGKNWRDFAVLYRMNAQSNQLEYAFKRNGIPYRIIGGTRFFDRAEVKDVLSYLCVIHNPSDDLRLMRIINNPPRGIGAKTIETVQQIAVSEGRPVYDILKESKNHPELQKSAAKLHLFVNIIEDMRFILQDIDLDEFYDLLIDRTGYIRALEEKNTDENAARIENVQELKSNIVNYMKETEVPTLAGFLDEIALYTDIEQYSADDNCVVMMTMHSAKGLEFPTVFIVGAEDGIFPGIKSIGEKEEMEEERRLCYVAMTRAKEKLYFTCAKQRMLFGKTSANRMSRFINEIPDEHIDKPPVEQRYIVSQSSEPSYYSQIERTERHISNIVDTPKKSSLSSAAPKLDYKVGDSVSHKAFGSGIIKSLKPVGGDALIEIEFESVGLKRLMLKAASAHMQKL